MLQTLLFFQGAPKPGGGLEMILLIGGMFVVMYFFMIRPQAKKAKVAKEFQAKLGKGEKVITFAGIHGTINKVNEDGTFQLEVSPGSYIKIEQSAVSHEMTAKLTKPVSTTTTK